MMAAKTRQVTIKIFGKKRFVPTEKFPLGKLPTLKEVIDRCLTFKDYKTDEIIKAVSEEFHNLWITYNVFSISINGRRRRRRRLKGIHSRPDKTQDWGRGFILLLPQTAALPGSDAGSDVIKPASSFVIQNRQTSCSMWCPMYRARC